MTTTLASDVRELFEGPNVADLATVLPDGAPHAVPVWWTWRVTGLRS
jgi:hypothetical protein